MKEQVLARLLEWCPDMFRPIAEFALPQAMNELSEEELIELNNTLEEAATKPVEEKAAILFAFVQKRDPSVKDLDLSKLDPFQLMGSLGRI